jgi:aspartate kinase
MSAPESEDQTPNVSFERERGVYATQIIHDVAHAVVSVEDDAQRTPRILQVFRVCADAGISIFLIKLHRTAVTFAVAGADVTRAETTLEQAGFQARTRRNLTLVVVRAASMRDLSGIMVEIADTLYSVGARLYETGDSHNSVQCLIESAPAREAVRALCRAFHLDESAIQETSLLAEAAA